MNNIIKKAFWYSTPFIIFLGGFFLAFFLFPRRHATVPSYLGKRAELAFAELSDLGFSGRCALVTVENPTLAGVVVDQLPENGARVYRGQTVRLTVGQQSNARMIPDFVGQPVSSLKNMAKEAGYEVTLVWMPHYRSMGICFAQTPPPHQIAHHARIICYCSLGSTPYGVMPNLRGLTREEVENFAHINNASAQCVSGKKESHSIAEKEFTVIDQQPAAGTVIDGNKQLFVQVQLTEPRS